MFIGLFKTHTNQIARETNTFGEAWSFLQRMAEGRDDIVQAEVLEEDEYLDDQCPDFDSCRVVASMRVVK